MFAREASEDQELATYLEQVILLKNDCEKGPGVDLAKQYEVRVYPTYAMVDHDGAVTDRWAGYPGVAGFIELVEAARADLRTIEQKRLAHAAQPTLALALSLGRYSESVFASTDAVRFYRQALSMDPDHAADLRGKVFLAMFYGLRGGDFTADELVAEGRAVLAADEVDPSTALTVASVTRRVADREAYTPILEAALAATEGVEGDMAAARRDLEVDAALLLEGDADRAVAMKRDLQPDGWLANPGALNSFAWWCFENDVNLDEAYELATRGADLASGDGDRANILDTAAEIAFKLGRVDQAVALQTEAVSLAPDRKGLQRNLERFQAGQGD